MIIKLKIKLIIKQIQNKSEEANMTTYRIIRKGNSAHKIEKGDVVTVHYRGRLKESNEIFT